MSLSLLTLMVEAAVLVHHRKTGSCFLGCGYSQSVQGCSCFLGLSFPASALWISTSKLHCSLPCPFPGPHHFLLFCYIFLLVSQKKWKDEFFILTDFILSPITCSTLQVSVVGTTLWTVGYLTACRFLLTSCQELPLDNTKLLTQPQNPLSCSCSHGLKPTVLKQHGSPEQL